MDREGDSYELFALLQEYEQRFVIRVGHDRRLEPGRGRCNAPMLNEALSKAPSVFEREVVLSARRKPSGSNKPSVFPARRRRSARLEARASSLELFPNNNAPAHAPSSVTLNFVEVREVDVPEGEPPVLWRLATTEPIGTQEEVAAVIDTYRQRWVIEEFFKAVKTGCRYEQLQLQTSHGLMIALAIESAVAWRMLRMRWLAQACPENPAEGLLPKRQHQVLSAIVRSNGLPGTTQPITAKEVLHAIAKLGGHIKNNGPPGWLTLRRGLDALLAVERGWNLAFQEGLPPDL